MCMNDVSSIILDASQDSNQGKGCYLTNLKDCVFNLHDFTQIDFDIVVANCENTWFSFWHHRWIGEQMDQHPERWTL